MPFQNCKIEGRNIDSAQYHALKNKVPRGSKEFVMSPSALKLFYRQPSKWVRGYNPPDSKSKRWGNILDCRALTPQLFDSRYSVRPGTYSSTVMECPSCGSQTDSQSCRSCKTTRIPKRIDKSWSPLAEECCQWHADQTSAGKEVISAKELSDCDAAIKRLLEPGPDGDDAVKRWFECSDRQVLIVGEWVDEETEIVIPVSALIDFVPRAGTEYDRCLGDLKTAKCAETLRFTEHAFDFGYFTQGSFDLAIFNAATGENRSEWAFIVSENYEPWEPNHIICETATGDPSCPALLDAGRMAQYGGYEGILAQYAQCLKHDRWPGYNSHDETVQGWSIARLDPFKLSKSTFSPKYVVKPEPDDEPETEEEGEWAP